MMFVECGVCVRYIKASQLPPKTKQALWRGIKAIEPNLAQLLKEDATLKALQTTFDAEIIFPESEIKRYLAVAHGAQA